MGCSRDIICFDVGRLRTTSTVIFLVSIVMGLRFCSADTVPKTLSFNKDIRQILSDNCFACHGPDQRMRQAQAAGHTFEDIMERSSNQLAPRGLGLLNGADAVHALWHARLGFFDRHGAQGIYTSPPTSKIINRRDLQ